MTKVKSREFISDSGTDSDDDVDAKPEKQDAKGEKRKSTELVLDYHGDGSSKKQKIDTDKQRTAKESESSDEEEKKEKVKKKKEKKKKPKESSDSEDEEPKKKKKNSSKKEAANAVDGNARDGFSLGRDRKISVSEFKGRKFVNIREYYDAGGEMKPGRKGIALSREQWDMFTQVKDDVSKAVVSDDKSWDLGKNKRVSLNEFKGKVLFDIREYYDAGGQLKPGKKGISLSREQWDIVHTVSDDITSAII